MADEQTVVKPLEALGIGGAGGEQTPYLVIAEGPRQGKRFLLREGTNVGGRLPTSDILLEDQSVSRHHFTVMRSGGALTVTDHDSKNGTIVNGQRIADAVTVGHGDILQIGIYALRMVTRSITPEEELAPLPPEFEGRTMLFEQPADPQAETATTIPQDAEGAGEEAGAEAADGGSSEPSAAPSRATAEARAIEQAHTARISELALKEVPERKRSRRKTIGLFALAIAVAGAATAAVYWRYFMAPPLEPTRPVAKTSPAKPAETPCPPGRHPVQPLTDPVQCEPDIPQPKTVPVFLDFASSPLPARVRFEGQELGLTPVKPNLPLEVGKTFTAEAVFSLEEIREELVERATFTVKETDTAIPILFRGPIGVFKVMKLPRDAELSVQGYFAHDPFQPRAMTLANVAYGKPVYVPYGRYIVELKAPRPIGEGGQIVPAIAYRREVALAEDTPIFALEVSDEAFQQFPVEILSVPAGADVFIDTKPVGKTPFAGMFPLGEHTLTLRKEGYFEHSEQLSNEINVPFRQEIALKTTVAGGLLNEGNHLLLKGMFKEAIAKLAEVFNSGPLPVETTKAQYLLGTAYLGLNDLATAQGYFDQAKSHPEYELQSKLGLVNILNTKGEKPQALYLLVEVMLKATDEAIKLEAANTFKAVSPFKSVLYVHSDPAGAAVYFNDQLLAQRTPLILSDLGMGNYRLRLQKDGFESQEVSMNMSVHEFNPVIVKLKPIAK
ncbi:MAG: PEGA domain-containing protein [Deltaproteobacteria bacterium]|nr:PEGA domain-containing protein [Deltaproteobacteria bacterium]